jgi:hypothetical protein
VSVESERRVRTEKAHPEKATHKGVTAESTLVVASPTLTATSESVTSRYTYNKNRVQVDAASGTVTVTPHEFKFDFQTAKAVGKTGVLLVGWVTASLYRCSIAPKGKKKQFFPTTFFFFFFFFSSLSTSNYFYYFFITIFYYIFYQIFLTSLFPLQRVATTAPP